MPGGDKGRGEPRSALEAQIDLILSGIRGVVEPLAEAAVFPDNWRDIGRVD